MGTLLQFKRLDVTKAERTTNDAAYAARMERIRKSLLRINTLMTELKKQGVNNED